MLRRTLLRSGLRSGLAAFALGAVPLARRAAAELRKMKITRVRLYESPITRPMINQSHHIVTVETDAGITGIGEGGSADLIRDCAVHLIGRDPSRIDALWQLMYRGSFYPAGREKLHALGALDMALWDIKGKALGVPVYELLGGASRDYLECYSTGFPSKASWRDAASACIQAGFRAIRISVAEPPRDAQNRLQPFNAQQIVRRTHQNCIETRAGVGNADWAIDFHTRFDMPDAVRLATLIEPLEPFFVEDLVRSENPSVYRQLRQQVKVPIAVGEQFGDRWDINELIEGRLIDYSRVSLPNCGGITEFVKHAAICETHYVGLIPHFTGPISEAALVHCCAPFSGPVLMEMRGAGPVPAAYLTNSFDFIEGKVRLNTRPGLGVDFKPDGLKLLAEADKAAEPVPQYRRPDGSFTNW